MAPANADLESKLFGSDHQMKKGAHIDKLEINADLEGPTKFPRIKKVCSRACVDQRHRKLTSPQFEDGGLHPIILENIQKCGYDCPTVIQSYVIPAVAKHSDIVAIAQTGALQCSRILACTVAD